MYFSISIKLLGPIFWSLQYQIIFHTYQLFMYASLEDFNCQICYFHMLLNIVPFSKLLRSHIIRLSQSSIVRIMQISNQRIKNNLFKFQDVI